VRRLRHLDARTGHGDREVRRRRRRRLRARRSHRPREEPRRSRHRGHDLRGVAEGRAPLSVRILGPGDEALVAAFCERHPDTTLFFQNNVAAAGLVDDGAPYSGRYAAAFAEGGITALVAHTWNGNVIVEAPVHAEAVARAAIAASGRDVAGLVGPYAQIVALRNALGLDATPATMDSPDELFAVSLADLRVPEPIARGAWIWRVPRTDELDLLAEWRAGYRVELMGEAAGPQLAARALEEIERNQSADRNFVLEVDEALVAYAGYNAATPRCVQIGGVWTPPPLRGRGYARAAVAGALIAARARGVERSILFTGIHNRAARAAYRALGYERIGDYGLVLFTAPQPLTASTTRR
jgi:RimJ/RimL family protein N-acetyltransferase